jgi:hypothetical protein
MKLKGLKAIISGLAGALTLTAIHQTLKNFVPNSPRIDLLGTTSIKNILSEFNITPPDEKATYNLSLAGDIVFNTLYYSLVATGKKSILNGSLLGIGAGSGVVSIPQLMNLGDEFSSKNLKQKILSFTIYLSGGLAAAGTYKLFEKYS